jgi:hypothetical protein
MVNNFFNNYLGSFKSFRWYSALVDISFVGIISLLLLVVGRFTESAVTKISMGLNTEELKQFFLTAPMDQLQQYYGNLQFYIVVFIILAVLTLIAILFAYSYSRALIWNKINNKKLSKKNYWKWNSLNLTLIVVLFFYLIFYWLIMLIFNALLKLITYPFTNFVMSHPDFIRGAITLLNAILASFLIILLLTFVFLAYFNFAKHYKVMSSWSWSFKKITGKLKLTLKIVFYGMLTYLFIGLLGLGIKNIFPAGWSTIFNVLLSLLYLAWFRIYLVKTIN